MFWVYLSTLMCRPGAGGPALPDDDRTGLRNTSGDWCCPSLSRAPTRCSCCANISAASRRTSSTRPGSTGPTRSTCWWRSCAAVPTDHRDTHRDHRREPLEPFMWPLVVTTGSHWRVVTVATARLQSQFNGNWTLVMAATTLALVPLLVLFLVFQRQSCARSPSPGLNRAHTIAVGSRYAARAPGSAEEAHGKRSTVIAAAWPPRSSSSPGSQRRLGVGGRDRPIAPPSRCGSGTTRSPRRTRRRSTNSSSTTQTSTSS